MGFVRIAIATATLACVAVAQPCLGAKGARMDENGICNVKAFGAKADGKTDDTAAIQRAMDEAGRLGGKVLIPAGQYAVKGTFKIPPGVQVEGVANAPVFSEPLKGSVILAYAGRDKEDGPALFELPNSTSVSGIVVYYPEQKTDDIRPYPWTFRMPGWDTTVENVTLVNSYNAIRTGPEVNCRHRIRNVYGCALRRGVFVDFCTDIGRVDNVHFCCHWWAPQTGGKDWNLVVKYMTENLEAFIFARTDWEYVTNTFVFPTKIGYHFIASDQGPCNAQLSGIGADNAQNAIVVDAVQSMGISITNGQFVATVGDNPVELVINETCTGSVRLVNCSFWGMATQNIVSHSKGFLSLSDCYLSSWREPNKASFDGAQDEKVKPLIEADSGRLQVRGCSFGSAQPGILLKKGLQHAIITENNGVNGVEVTNEIGNAAVIANNEPRADASR